MAEWIIPCNPHYFDIFAAFDKLETIDWRQSATSINAGDTVYIYVGSPVQAVAFRCIVEKTGIRPEQVDRSDEEFSKEDQMDDYYQYMRVRLIEKYPTDVVTLDRMHEAGMPGNIQSPRRVTGGLKRLIDSSFGGDSANIPYFRATGNVSQYCNPGKSAVKYDVERIMSDLRNSAEMDPDSSDGSYLMMRETIQSYADLPDLSEIDYRDLNLVYLTTVGTWKQGISSKKKTIDESHLSAENKEYLKELWDEIWRQAGEGMYAETSWQEDGSPAIGMFGTGFFTFQTKTTTENARDFIAMCIDILPMRNDLEMFDRAARVLNSSFRGMQAASASMVLHCLKPLTFPVLNGNMGFKNIFETLGVPLKRCYYLDAYIDNCRKIKVFRDQNFTWKNYRIFDNIAREVDKYALKTVASEKSAEPIQQPQIVSQPEQIDSESSVSAGVRERFIQQIHEKKAELESLDQKREKLAKEIELLEEMLRGI